MSREDRRSSPPRLFDRHELTLQPTGMARWRRVASRPARHITEKELREDEDRKAMERLREQGADLCRRFGLRFLAIEAERDGVHGHYGICYEDGLIRIRLRHARTDRLLKESSLVDTLCHELAHLRHLDHSKRFQRLYKRILDTARRLGYYRPGPLAGHRAIQLDLFEAGACGTTAAKE